MTGTQEVHQMGTVVFVNVGGVYFTTSRRTLSDSNSFFSTAMQDSGDEVEIFVDRDPTYFRHILNWMRGSRFIPNDDQILQELLWESDYYRMHDLREAIQRSKRRFDMQGAIMSIVGDVKTIAQTRGDRSRGGVKTQGKKLT